MPKPSSNPKEVKGAKPNQGKTEKAQKQPKVIQESSDSESEEEVTKVVPKKQDQKSSKIPPKPTKKVVESEEESSSDEEVPAQRPVSKAHPSKNPVDTKQQKKKIIKEESSEDEEEDIEEDDEEEEVPAKRPLPKAQPSKKPADTKQAKKKIIEEEEEEEDEGEAIEEDDDYEIGDDDIYIPKKKVKTSKGKEKVIAKATANGEAKTEEQKDDIEKYYDNLVKNKASRLAKKQNGNTDRGVLYIGHLPYGFAEEALSKYFEQYGDILNYHLARSKKTARSMGYAFVEFKYKEVAKAAADAMNGYMMYGKKLECRVLPDSEAVRVKTKKFKFIPYNKQFIQQKNKARSAQELRKEVKHLLKAEERRRERLKELGIEYDFPGFKTLIEEVAKLKKKEIQKNKKSEELKTQKKKKK